jgi:hypothetical protein
MDILDRLLGHDAWTTRQLLLRCRELTEEQLDRHFEIGDRSLRETFQHIMENMEIWTAAGQQARSAAELRDWLGRRCEAGPRRRRRSNGAATGPNAGNEHETAGTGSVDRELAPVTRFRAVLPHQSVPKAVFMRSPARCQAPYPAHPATADRLQRPP